MYIEPNTTIKLLSGVRLDNTYENTLYFPNLSSQLSYFNSKAIHSFLNQTYQRLDTGKMTLNMKADTLYNCNYIMFQNSAYGNKWFFAFLLKVDFVNNATSVVTFEIDVIQTWLFEAQLMPSFVERQHVFTDKIGDNLVQDNLELGDYKYQRLDVESHFDRWMVCVAATFDKDFNDAPGGLVGGIFSGLCYNTFLSPAAAATFIAEATENNYANGIVSVFMIPEDFGSPPAGSTNPNFYNVNIQKSYTNIDGYVPHNNKLFTYPYNTLYVTNNEGIGSDFPFEYFEGDTQCSFRESCIMSCSPEAACIPLLYKGVYLNYNEKIVLENFPQCAYAIDSYRAWIAQNRARLLMTGIRQGVNALRAMTGVDYASAGIAGAATGETGNAITGAFFNHVNTALDTADIIANMYDHYTMPMQATSGGGGSLNIALGIKGFQYYRAYIRKEYATIIDGYWDLYGYPIHQVQTPNRNARKNWTYLKTKGANITGNIPSMYLSLIKALYNRGMRWWNNGDYVGLYQLDNPPNGGT